MSNENMILDVQKIQNKIYTIREKQVMLDKDLAEMYQVETKALNRAVKRNINRFPEKFRFQLSEEEYQNLRYQIGTSSEHGGKRYLPYVFTEQGVSMLSGVLRSDVAVNISISIMDAFVEMRKFIAINTGLFQRLNNIEKEQIENKSKFERIFEAIETKEIKYKEGIFFDGQVYDAYVFVTDVIKSAKKSIVLIDGYIDETVLTMLSKRRKNCTATIYTKKISKQLQLDLQKHNDQYPPIEIKNLKTSHDRFLILDDKTIYHIGASLKDLGKQWFAFSKLEKGAFEILEKLKK